MRDEKLDVRGNVAPHHFLLGISYFSLAALGLTLGLLIRGLRFDDPFITYRFAQHVANGTGFAFNVGEAGPLITTAPLYALLLAMPAALGSDIPTTSYWIGVVSLTVASMLLFTLGRTHGQSRLGFIAALVLLSFPLGWLTMGFETPLFMAVTLLAFMLVANGRPVWAGMVGGVAMGLRGDGAIVVGVLAVGCWLMSTHGREASANLLQSRLKPPLRLFIASLLTYTPLALWLTLQFGSPLPTTLQTKAAQAVSGLTGFYAGTTFPEGAWLLIQAYVQQTPLFAALIILIVLGIVHCVRSVLVGLRLGLHFGMEVSTDTDYRLKSPFPKIFFLPILWAVAHFVGYTLIRVAPYPWYYVPMLPGIACLVALGADFVGNALRGVPLLSLVVVLALAPSAIGLAHIIDVLHGSTPPQPSEVAAKVLPEVKVDSYERVGRWIDANTPMTATLGVTELGVMSYYARRHTIDFLGLTQPDQLGAIRHGDYLASLLRTQPDYLALTNWNSLYDNNPQDKDWFRALYAPMATFYDPRFWGSPMTVWQRTTAPVTQSITLAEGAFDLSDGWQVTGVAVSARTVITTTPLIVRVQLRAPSTAIGLQSQRTLRVQPITVKRGDGLPPTSRPIQTQLFRAREEVWLDFPILPYPNARAGEYEISIRWDDSDKDVIVGRITVPATAVP